MTQYAKGNREWHIVNETQPTVKIDGRTYTNGVGPNCTTLAPAKPSRTDSDPVCDCCAAYPSLSAGAKAMIDTFNERNH